VKEEIVVRVIDNLSLGNSSIKRVFTLAYLEGKPVIDKWPDSCTGLLSRKMIRIASNLIHKRISGQEMILNGAKYWETNNGIDVNEAAANFIKKRELKVLQQKSQG
jgi:hypothetical protein